MGEPNQKVLEYASPDKGTRRFRLLKTGSRISFALYAISYFLAMCTLCWCPEEYLFTAAFTVFPIVAGPKRFHRCVGLVLLMIALSGAMDAQRHKTAERARVAQVKARIQQQASTTQATTEP